MDRHTWKHSSALSSILDTQKTYGSPLEDEPPSWLRGTVMPIGQARNARNPSQDILSIGEMVPCPGAQRSNI